MNIVYWNRNGLLSLRNPARGANQLQIGICLNMNLKPAVFRSNIFSIILILLIFPVSPLLAQLNVSAQSFHYPQKLEYKEWKNEINLILATLPEDYVEEVSSYIYAPLFSYETKFGLPYGFFQQGGIS